MAFHPPSFSRLLSLFWNISTKLKNNLQHFPQGKKDKKQHFFCQKNITKFDRDTSVQRLQEKKKKNRKRLMETLPALAWALLRTETCWSSGFLVARGKEIIKNINWTKHSLKKRANLFSGKTILSFKDLQMAISWSAPTLRPLYGPFQQQRVSPPRLFWSPCSSYCGQFLCVTLSLGRAEYYTRPTVWYDQIHLSLCSFSAQLWQSFVTDVTSSNHWKVTPGQTWVQMHFIRLMPLLFLATSSSSFLVLMPSSKFPTGDHPPPEGLEGRYPSVRVIRVQ